MAKRGRKPKLTPEDVAEIQRMYSKDTKPGWTIGNLAHVFHVSTAVISKALNQKLEKN